MSSITANHPIPPELLRPRTASVVSSTISKVTSFIHHHFLVILICAYVLSGIIPGPGLFIRDISFGQLNMPGGGSVNLSPSLLMLSFLLFNAGLGIKLKELKNLAQNPALTMAGFLANTIVPLLLIVAASGIFGAWHNQDEVQNLLVGLALIVSMPIAGSSTAWSQNANGNLALSLGLVLLSTLMSPLLTPITLSVFSILTSGHYSNDLSMIAAQGTNTFMCLTVVLPALAGIGMNYILGDRIKERLIPAMKLFNYAALLMLNYSNAATSVPKMFVHCDLDLIGLMILVTGVLCFLAFTAGWAICRLFQADKAETASLMFGLGMNNNGTGLVLASAMLADHPAVMLPLIFYTLFQQIIAAVVDKLFFKNED